jgi:hypothetical protein
MRSIRRRVAVLAAAAPAASGLTLGTVASPAGAASPTGLHDAATHAAIRLAELSSSDRARVSRLMDNEYALLDYDPTLDRLNLLDGWEAAEVTIDGVGHECRVRRLDDAWAILVDLPDVAIVVTGPGSLPQMRLVNVSDRIGQYA